MCRVLEKAFCSPTFNILPPLKTTYPRAKTTSGRKELGTMFKSPGEHFLIFSDQVWAQNSGISDAEDRELYPIVN
jgi:hypothetical protein